MGAAVRPCYETINHPGSQGVGERFVRWQFFQYDFDSLCGQYAQHSLRRRIDPRHAGSERDIDTAR